jgi:hypothetical protein
MEGGPVSNEKMTESKVLQVLNWAYDKALNGPPGVETATGLGDDYTKGEGSLHDRVNRLIRWQVAKASAAGFVSGLGGLLTMPITLPADFAVVSYIELRMIAAIAHMGGHDVHEDAVRTMAFVCMCGEAPAEVVRGVGVKLGEKLAEKAVQSISADAIKAINKAVGIRLLSKFGSTAVINFGKAIPFVGAAVGGAADGYFVNAVGNVARDFFATPTP